MSLPRKEEQVEHQLQRKLGALLEPLKAHGDEQEEPSRSLLVAPCSKQLLLPQLEQLLAHYHWRDVRERLA